MILKAVPSTNPALSNADQNFGISDSDKTRSRLFVPLRATSLHGLLLTISSRIAQVKIALAAASTWFAKIAAAMLRMTALTSARGIESASSLPQRGRRHLLTSASA
jgi:hypothetical protein